MGKNKVPEIVKLILLDHLPVHGDIHAEADDPDEQTAGQHFSPQPK
jgi:hypothetical protein